MKLYVAWWVAVIVAVVVVFVAGSAGSVGTSGGGGSVPASPSTCFTKCGFFMEFRCEDGKLIGVCFPFWPCNAEIGAHQCVRPGTGLLDKLRNNHAAYPASKTPCVIDAATGRCVDA
jgi:hypothetical protein